MRELALHILDIAENSIRAGADKINMMLCYEKRTDELMFEIQDNGSGMSPKMVRSTIDPFFTSRTSRDVGLGIPLFKQHAEMTGGSLSIESNEGEGAKLKVKMFKDHPDMQPLGDIEGCWIMLASSNPSLEFELCFETDRGVFSINSTEVREELELDNLLDSGVQIQLKRLIRNNMEELGLV